jgi:uncharacterized protein (TIGR03000 family)
MFARLEKLLALAALVVFVCSWWAQPAQSQGIQPYGPYGYTPGAYDYSPSPPRSYSRSYGPTYSFGSSFGNPTYGRYGYTPGAYDNSGPTYRYRPSYSYTAYRYVAPSRWVGTMPPQPASRQDDRTVHIQLRVPPDAKVWFDGEATTQRGEVRNFQSPSLDPAKQYSYEIRATWQQDGRPIEHTRRVRVRAGDRIRVNLAEWETDRTAGR